MPLLRRQRQPTSSTFGRQPLEIPDSCCRYSPGRQNLFPANNDDDSILSHLHPPIRQAHIWPSQRPAARHVNVHRERHVSFVSPARSRLGRVCARGWVFDAVFAHAYPGQAAVAACWSSREISGGRPIFRGRSRRSVRCEIREKPCIDWWGGGGSARGFGMYLGHLREERFLADCTARTLRFVRWVRERIYWKSLRFIGSGKFFRGIWSNGGAAYLNGNVWRVV